MNSAPQLTLTSRPQPVNQAAPIKSVPSHPVSNPQEIPLLMSVPDLSEQRPVSKPLDEQKPLEKQRHEYDFSAPKFKLSVPPVATLSGLIGLAVVLVLVLLSRGGDESASTPSEAPEDSSTEVLLRDPTEPESGEEQMARLGLADKPADDAGTEDAGKSPYLPIAESPDPNKSNPQSSGQAVGKKPSVTKPGQYPQTDTPWPVYLEAKRPERSATRPPVEFKGTIANPNFRARNESQRSRVH